MALERIDKKLLIFVGCGLTLLIIVLGIRGELGTQSNNQVEAQIACEDALENSLKAPKGAEISTLKYTRSETTPTNWKFWGSVTASNSFGAFLTKTWTCSYLEGYASVSIDE